MYTLRKNEHCIETVAPERRSTRKLHRGVTSTARWSSPEEVSTQADHRVLGGVQADVTLEGAVLVAAVGRRRAAGSGARAFSGRGGARGRGRGHLKKKRFTQQEVKRSADTQRFKIRT